MNFYDNAVILKDNIEEIYSKIESNINDIPNIWQGPAADRYLTKSREILEVLKVLKSHAQEYVNVGSKLKEIINTNSELTHLNKEMQAKVYSEQKKSELTSLHVELNIKKTNLISDIKVILRKII